MHDPQFAPAYLGLAMSYNLSGSSYGVLSPNDAFPKAKAAAREALRLDPDLAEAHSELAYEKVTFEHDWTGAKEEFQRAIELNPNSADAHYVYALSWLTPTGRHDEAIAEIRKALQLDPVSLPNNQGAVYIFYYARQYQQAVDQCRKTIEMDQNFAGGHGDWPRWMVNWVTMTNLFRNWKKRGDWMEGHPTTWLLALRRCGVPFGNQGHGDIGKSTASFSSMA